MQDFSRLQNRKELAVALPLVCAERLKGWVAEYDVGLCQLLTEYGRSQGVAAMQPPAVWIRVVRKHERKPGDFPSKVVDFNAGKHPDEVFMALSGTHFYRQELPQPLHCSH